MTFEIFVQAVIADGDVTVTVSAARTSGVLVHLSAPGVSVEPVAHRRSLRGVRAVAVVVAAALDTESDPGITM